MKTVRCLKNPQQPNPYSQTCQQQVLRPAPYKPYSKQQWHVRQLPFLLPTPIPQAFSTTGARGPWCMQRSRSITESFGQNHEKLQQHYATSTHLPLLDPCTCSGCNTAAPTLQQAALHAMLTCEQALAQPLLPGPGYHTPAPAHSSGNACVPRRSASATWLRTKCAK